MGEYKIRQLMCHICNHPEL